ncbi:hypothetical protein SALBM217S_00989 [Streptomyces griseoloalbus]
MPDAFELLKARINFDLTGKNAEKRMGYGAIGVSIGAVIIAYRLGGTSDDFVIAAIIWLALMAILGIGFVVTRKRNAKFAARLQAANFTPVTDETGRVRYLPPGGQMPGHGNPFGAAPYGPYGAQAQGAPPVPPQPQQQPAPGYAPQQPPGVPAALPAAATAAARSVRPPAAARLWPARAARPVRPARPLRPAPAALTPHRTPGDR